jgi:hypothetical protein
VFPFGWYLVGLVIFVAVILLEAWRQRRKSRCAGLKSQGRPGLIAAGMLELQALLQPDRKVEQMVEETRDKERVNPAYRPGGAGDDSRGLGGPPRTFRSGPSGQGERR